MALLHLEGQRFERLRVLRRCESIRPGEHVFRWVCVCDCQPDVEIEIRGDFLRNGGAKSCGCLQRENRRRMKSIAGRKYGFLKAVRYVRKGAFSSVWLWECVCGKLIEADLNGVRGGKKKSCGCKSFESWNKNAENARAGIDLRDGTCVTKIREALKTNGKVYKNNTSGVTGVCWDGRSKKWCARIGFQGKRILLGYFMDFDEAVKARKKAEEKYFGGYLESLKADKDKTEK